MSVLKIFDKHNDKLIANFIDNMPPETRGVIDPNDFEFDLPLNKLQLCL